MKIVVLQDYLRGGGTERQSVQLAAAFAREGHPATLVTFRPGGPLADLARQLSVPHHCIQPFDTHLDAFAPGLLHTLRAEQPDVVLCMGRVANLKALRIQRALPGALVVGTVRTGRTLPWRLPGILRQLRVVIVNSATIAAAVVAGGVAPDHVFTIRNGVTRPWPPADLAQRRLRARAASGAGEGTTVLLCVAGFRPGKGQDHLLRALAPVPGDWQLWLAGDGPREARCRALARTLGLEDRVRFLGFQSDTTDLYAGADVAVMASEAESLPNFLLEAQLAGLPVVAYAVGGVPECFEPGLTGWGVPFGDHGAFRAALQPLLADPGKRQHIAAKAAAFVRANFDAASQPRRYLDLFSRLRALPAP